MCFGSLGHSLGPLEGSLACVLALKVLKGIFSIPKIAFEVRFLHPKGHFGMFFGFQESS